jgi:hypothetical protein
VTPVGTFTVISVAVAVSAFAETPLNVTVLFAGVVLKLVPLIVIVSPSSPLPGLILLMVGADTVGVGTTVVGVGVGTTVVGVGVGTTVVGVGVGPDTVGVGTMVPPPPPPPL